LELATFRGKGAVMGDLISRKAVMDYLREQQANVIIEQNKENHVTYEATKGMLSSVDAFMNFIVQLPTVYDVDRAVEQITKKAIAEDEVLYVNGDKITYFVRLDEVIEILKGAVKDE
jgi:small nuclear ribonucleoprotein (snRNP)-like protein